MADAIPLHQCVMGSMRGGRRDRPFQEPHQGPQRRHAVELLVPAHCGVRPHDHGHLDDHVTHVGPAETEEHQSATEPQPRHHRVVKRIVAVDHADAHVGRGMMGAMQGPQQAGVRQPVPEILGEVVRQQQGEDHGPPRPVRQRTAHSGHRPLAEGRRRQQHRGGDQRENQQDRQVQPVVLAIRLGREEPATQDFSQREQPEQRRRHAKLEDLRVQVGHGIKIRCSGVASLKFSRGPRIRSCPLVPVSPVSRGPALRDS